MAKNKCPKCQFENPDGTIYCGKCATPLEFEGEASPQYTETLQISKKELPVGSTFAERYHILEAIGAGGMGKVYKANDVKLNEDIALKLLKPEIATDEHTIERFRNELKLARRITHKNVCRMHDFHEEKETPYITMEYVSGESLKMFIKKQGRLSEEITLSIAIQIGRGLSEAHELGVIHRDLKPSNIMIDEKDTVKIMDFGIARSMVAKGVTQTGLIIGTPDYMSPEQAEGKDTDQRSDIYSLGVILYEMLTGSLPFVGDYALSISMNHKSERPPDPRTINNQVSENMSALILKCMEKEREYRYQSIEELLSDLENIEKGIDTAAVPSKLQVPAFLIEGEEESRDGRPVFVARQPELDKLRLFLETALSGKGQVAFVTGEAGSGKTALVQEFARRSQDANPELIVAQGKCNAHTGIGDPYLPFIEILRLLTGDVETKWAAGIITKEHAARLWNLLPLSANAVLEKGSDLINIFIPGGELVSRCEALTSGRANWLIPLKNIVERKAKLPADLTLQQSDLFEQYTRVLETLARKKPLLLILDDLQWVDAGSASLLFHLGRRIAGSRIMIIGVFRPSEIDLGRSGERHPIDPVIHEFKRDFGSLEVEVGKEEGRQFVDAFLDSEPNRLGQEFRDTLFRQTNGHSLFTVELLRDMQDKGVLIKDNEGQWVEGPKLDWKTLPVRVDAVVEERISRLSSKLREVLTLASVEGEEFTAEVVARLQETEVRELIRLLSSELDKRHHLVSAKGIRRLERQRLSLYLFQHILFQRYLYNSLDDVEKAHLHEEVGNILETLYGEQAGEIAVQLARHFEEAGNSSKSFEYQQKAGQRALQLSAHQEALVYFDKCLHLLETFPDTPERAQQELVIQLSRTVPLYATKGLASPEVGKALDRVQNLCQQLGNPPQLLEAMTSLAQFYGLRAEYHSAINLIEKIVKIAEEAGDTQFVHLGPSLATWSYLNLGDFLKSRATAEGWDKVYDPEKHAPLMFIFGWDIGVITLSVGAWAAWFLGYPDTAGKKRHEEVALARRLNHPHTLAFALTFDIVIRIYRREFEGIKELIEELIRLSWEKGFIYWEAHGIFYDGYVQALEREFEEGIAKMHRALEILEAIGAGTCFTRLYTRIMEAYILTKETNKGLEIFDKAMAILHRDDERYCEAELYRLKGELLLVKAEEMKTREGTKKSEKEKVRKLEEEAESLFRKAIDVSLDQKAKSLELRAVVSLSRLLKKQGREDIIKQSLQDVYAWFTEGLDTLDLQEAKALLDEMS
jgi:serine/threonine protein kinase/tetratricopeptide (TPR) repeat protein